MRSSIAYERRVLEACRSRKKRAIGRTGRFGRLEAEDDEEEAENEEID